MWLEESWKSGDAGSFELDVQAEVDFKAHHFAEKCPGISSNSVDELEFALVIEKSLSLESR